MSKPTKQLNITALGESVELGTTGAKIEATSEGITFDSPSISIPLYADTTERDAAIPTPAESNVCIVAGKLNVYNGSDWEELQAIIEGDSLDVPSLSTEPVGASDGHIYYNTTTTEFQFRENGVWIGLSGGGGGGGGASGLVEKDEITKSSAFTADVNKLYEVDFAGLGVIAITAPSSPAYGDEVGIKFVSEDPASNFPDLSSFYIPNWVPQTTDEQIVLRYVEGNFEDQWIVVSHTPVSDRVSGNVYCELVEVFGDDTWPVTFGRAIPPGSLITNVKMQIASPFDDVGVGKIKVGYTGGSHDDLVNPGTDTEIDSTVSGSFTIEHAEFTNVSEQLVVDFDTPKPTNEGHARVYVQYTVTDFDVPE